MTPLDILIQQHNNLRPVLLNKIKSLLEQFHPNTDYINVKVNTSYDYFDVATDYDGRVTLQRIWSDGTIDYRVNSINITDIHNNHNILYTELPTETLILIANFLING